MRNGMKLQELIDSLIALRDEHDKHQLMYDEDERIKGSLLPVMLSNNINEPQEVPFVVFKSMSPYTGEEFISIEFDRLGMGLVNWVGCYDRNK